MNAVGIICEYNPLHKGHMHQMRLAKEQSGADVLVCVMSGAFVQRGEPALFDAFTRARWAVQSGADIVILLPHIYALSSADDFARGGMMTLKASGIVSSFSFGSKCTDLDALSAAAQWLQNPSEAVSAKIRQSLAGGMGYPAALSLAAKESAPEGVSEQTLCALLESANDTLGIRYLLENEKSTPHLSPFPVRREDRFASASDLRQAILTQTLPQSQQLIFENAPTFAAQEMLQKKPCRPSFYDAMLAANLRLCTRSTLSDVCCMTPHLCDDLFSAAQRCADAQGIVDLASGRHRTRARVRRAMWHAMLRVDPALYRESKAQAPYLRVLAVKKGRENLLGALKTHARIPVLTGGKTEHLSPFAQECAALDSRAMDLQAMCLDDVSCGAWFTKKLQKA